MLQRRRDTETYMMHCCKDVIEGHDDVFDLVFVNDKLTCEMPTELPYYVAFTDPVCFYCGNDNEQDVAEEAGHYPLCKECK